MLACWDLDVKYEYDTAPSRRCWVQSSAQQTVGRINYLFVCSISVYSSHVQRIAKCAEVIPTLSIRRFHWLAVLHPEWNQSIKSTVVLDRKKRTPLSAVHCEWLQWNVSCLHPFITPGKHIHQNPKNVIKSKTWLQTCEIPWRGQATAPSNRWRLINTASTSHLISPAILLVKA